VMGLCGIAKIAEIGPDLLMRSRARAGGSHS
jgi:hypothetical protein